MVGAYKMKEFIARCSQLGTLVELTKLTDKQLETLNELIVKEKEKPLTKIQENTKNELQFKHEHPELMAGAKTLLNDWYAYKLGRDRENIFIKEAQKGIIMESKGIEFLDEFLLGGVGLVKNERKESNKFIEGTCDVEHDDFTADIKLPWDSRTFYSKIVKEIDKDYIWQGKGYSILYNKPKCYLTYILLDTPVWAYLQASFKGVRLETMEFESTYGHIPDSERIFIIEIPVLESDEKQINLAVSKAREYLEIHEALVKSKLGVVNQLWT